MRPNLNRILRLQIRGKLAIAFTALSILPVIIVGLFGLTSNIATLRRVAIEDLNHDLLTTKARVANFIAGFEESVDLLTKSASFQKFIYAVDAGDSLGLSRALQDVQPDLITFAQQKQLFYQIKYFDRLGDEYFVVEQYGKNGYRSHLPSELNQTGSTLYFYLVDRNPEKRVLVLPAEFRGPEHENLLPSIVCVYPVRQPKLTGILVFHIKAEAFFDVIEQETAHNLDGNIMLVNSEGTYLYHSTKKKDWNRLLASKDSLNLQTDYGSGQARKLLSATSARTLEFNDEIVAHAPLFDEQSGFGGYTLLRSVSKKEIFAETKTFGLFFVIVSTTFLVVALLLSYWATRQFTEPLEKLEREASVIAEGNYRARVNIKTHDEIEQLAGQFNVMAESLQQREEEIARHRGQLENTVQQRTRELSAEKDKLRAILDNVPSGFLLLDRNFKILSASAALEKISGKPVNKTVGLSCKDVLGDGEVCEHCPGDLAFQSGKMQRKVSSRVTSEGEKRYFEHMSVPIKSKGRVEQILEIITDVTERRRLQEQLVHSERLAATGEMAAVIAHEMRNSLTSVTMILQLLATTEGVLASESESLEVALNSLHRMETVVMDLLQLARPSPMKRCLTDVNDIAGEAIELARHEIDKRGISLQQELAENLPLLELDPEHMKEAIVNLLLNAAQAVDGKGGITISTRLRILQQSLRSVGEVAVTKGDVTDFDVHDVVLTSGTRVVQIDIKDSGCGIPETTVERIFDPFYTTKTDGTGLGLSFVRRVASEHDGLVLATSKLAEGSCFSIVMPVT